MASSQVRVAERTEVPGVIRLLAEGMRDDPLLAWVYPDPASRTRRVERLFGLVARLYPDAEVFRNDDLSAGAFWVRPGRFHVPVGRQIRLFPATAKALGGMAGLGMSAAVDASHPKEPDHYYLLILATAPGNRGRGLGTELMRPVLERCDADGVPAYLESANQRNQPFYERLGFEVRQEIDLPGGCPPLWGMWREARSSVAN